MRRRAALALSVLLVAGACGDGAREEGAPTPPVVHLDERGGPGPSSAPSERDEDDGPSVVVPDGRAPSGSSQSVAPGAQPADHGSVGSNAFLYLNARVPRLVIEVDAVAGAAPSDGLLSLLVARLRSVVDKPGGIDVLETETIPGSGDGVWTTDDLAASARRHRDVTSTSERMVLYLQFVDGRYESGDVVGVAHSASAAAIFTEHIEEIATLLVSAEAIAGAATVHELGHLLSLVNIGYRSPRDHEDPENRKHSKNPDSVMFWAVDNVGVVSVLGGRTKPPTDFDADDRADLRDVGDGKLG